MPAHILHYKGRLIKESYSDIPGKEKLASVIINGEVTRAMKEMGRYEFKSGDSKVDFLPFIP